MAFLIQRDCKCCQKAMNTGDAHHCEACWNEHHNGQRDHDFLPRDEFEKTHAGEVEALKKGVRLVKALEEASTPEERKQLLEQFKNGIIPNE